MEKDIIISAANMSKLVSTAEPEEKHVIVATAALRGLLKVESKKEEQKVS